MSNTPPPTNQELFAILSELLLHERSSMIQGAFAGNPFPRHFHTLEVNRGKYRFLEELPQKVLVYTEAAAVRSALLTFLHNLDSEFSVYKFTADKTRQAVDYWMCREETRFKHKIWPVLELNEPGYAHHRLDFNARQEETPLFDSFMARVRTNPEALMAFIGALFDPTFSRQFYLWMYGSGGDGKGTILRFIKRLFGNAYTSLPSDFKQQNQFFTAALVGKRVGAFQDCHNPRIVQSETFMQLTGGDAMRIEEKGQPAYMADLDTMIIVSSNFEPELTSSEAHRRRAVICHMLDRTESDGDPATYGERMWLERAGIVWKCKEAWRAMKAEHGDMKPDQEITREIAASGEVKWERLLEKYFVIDLTKNGTLKPVDFYAVLHEREHLSPFEIKPFKQYIERLGVNTRFRPNPNVQRIMRGLHLRDNVKLDNPTAQPSF